jgi:hypothetical protein
MSIETGTIRPELMPAKAEVLKPGEIGLPELATRIKAAYAAIGQACKDVVGRAVAMGDLLNQAKNRMAHGNWSAWLQANCELSERTAQRYMSIADNKQKIAEYIQSKESKSATMTGLTLAEVVAAISGNGGGGSDKGDAVSKSMTTFFNALKKLKEPEERKAAAKQMQQRLKDVGYL